MDSIISESHTESYTEVKRQHVCVCLLALYDCHCLLIATYHRSGFMNSVV